MAETAINTLYKGKWTIGQLEDYLFQFEELRIVFRASKMTIVNPWPFKYKVGDEMTIVQMQEKLERNYPGIPFEIINGNGIMIHSSLIRLGALRKSYSALSSLNKVV